MIAREEFLEYISVLGNYYGTSHHSLQQAEENGKDLLIKVDESGVAQIKQKIPDAVSILVMPGQLAQEKGAIGSATDPIVLFRLHEASAPSELPNPDKYDHVIVSDRLEDSANRVIEIIRSERSRRS
jgi:guanylate kinase